jgi:hypothetical protein
LDAAIRETLNGLKFNEVENQYFRQQIKQAFQNITELSAAQTQTFSMQLEQTRERLSKLADAYIDGMVEKETYLMKKNKLVVEEAAIKSHLELVEATEQQALRRVEAFLELINNAYLSYKLGTQDEKRELAKIITSNFFVKDKNVSIKLNYPFQVVADRQVITGGSPDRGTDRTLSALLKQLHVYFQKNDITPESKVEGQSQIKLSLDRAILIGSRKITNQTF